MPAQLLPTIQNQNPSVIFHKEITLSTQDEITGQNIIEGYNVNGPSHSSINPIPLAGGTKFVVPITTDTGSGAPYLKFHFPNGTSGNKVYVTFAVKNARMADGYYDYTTGIPTTYKSQLKSFILAPVNTIQLLNANGVRTKDLRFTAYGSSTNKPAEAVTFYISFKALFSSNAVNQNNTAGSVVVAGNTGTNTGTASTGTGIQLTGFPAGTTSTSNSSL